MEKYKQKVKQLLIHFLKENNIFEQFMKNSLNAGEEWKRVHPIANKKPIALNSIKVNFSWSDTPEGFEYWHCLYRKWLLTLMQYFLEDLCLYESFKYATNITEPLPNYFSLIFNDSKAEEYAFTRLLNNSHLSIGDKETWRYFNDKWMELVRTLKLVEI